MKILNKKSLIVVFVSGIFLHDASALRGSFRAAATSMFRHLADQARIAETNCLTGVPSSRLRDHGVRFVEAIKSIAVTAERVGDERAVDGLHGSAYDRDARDAWESWNARYPRSDEDLKRRGSDMHRRLNAMFEEYEKTTEGK